MSARFAQESDGVDATITSPGGFGGAPVFDPGEVVTHTIDVPDPGENRYFSFASMVIPSNDAFLANLDSRAHRLFNGNGRFRGPITIDLSGRDVYDAGTEVNDPQGGAAFSTLGGVSVDEGGVIHSHAGLDDFVGTGLPTGNSLGSAFIDQTPLARITISLASDPSGPIDHEGPEATLGTMAASVVPGSTSFEFDVIYSDPSGVDVSSIDTSDVRVLPRIRGGRWLRPTGVTTDAVPGTSPPTVVATYAIDAPGGEFDPEDSGSYRVFLRHDEVHDTLGNGNRGQRIGSFEVDVPAQLELTIENLSDDGGLFLTPFWAGFHDGRFDLGSRGLSADRFPGLEELAEEGDTSILSDYFNQTTDGVDTTILAPGGFPGAPVLDPGESATQAIEVAFAGDNRFFSFASMVIPSNDAFLANLSSRAHRVFDRSGRFRGPVTIDLFGRDVLDAGTEVNNPQGGAAFSTEGGVSQDEGGDRRLSHRETLLRNRSLACMSRRRFIFHKAKVRFQPCSIRLVTVRAQRIESCISRRRS